MTGGEKMSNDKAALRAFWEKCRLFDWLHEYSDDGEVARRGRQRQDELAEEAKKSPEYQAIFDGWKANAGMRAGLSPPAPPLP